MFELSNKWYLYSVNSPTLKINQGYNINLPQFEGPFDLLLFFIERDELDIYDIPIAKITKDFLDYIKELESLDVDLAGEFIVVAATLMSIKAKMLIPRKALDEEGNEIDPRQELIDRLLEYKQYKSILEEMRQLEKERSLKFERGNTKTDLKTIATKALVDIELESLTLFKLLKVYEKAMMKYEDRSKVKKVHQITTYNYTIEDQKSLIVIKLSKGQKANFLDVFGKCENKLHAIVTFLALLEMINMQEVFITVGEGYNNFWIGNKSAA